MRDETVEGFGRFDAFHSAHPPPRIHQRQRPTGFQLRSAAEGQRPHLPKELPCVRAAHGSPLPRVGVASRQLGTDVDHRIRRRHCHLEDSSRRPYVANAVLQALERRPKPLCTRHAAGVQESHEPHPPGEAVAVKAGPARLDEGEGRKRPKHRRDAWGPPKQAGKERPTSEQPDGEHPKPWPAHEGREGTLDSGGLRDAGPYLIFGEKVAFSPAFTVTVELLGLATSWKVAISYVPGGTSLISKVPSFAVSTA